MPRSHSWGQLASTQNMENVIHDVVRIGEDRTFTLYKLLSNFVDKKKRQFVFFAAGQTTRSSQSGVFIDSIQNR